MTKNKLTTERLEAIRTNAERIAGGGLITDINEIPSIGRMASEDVPALLAEIERLRNGIEVAIEITFCDDTLDNLNRVLDGKEALDLVYRYGGDA